jgi:hypothetical protein
MWYNIDTKESEVLNMENIIALISVLVMIAVFGIVIFGTWGICNLVNYIQNKKHKKWCAWVFENYPELKVLLSEYSRLRKEHCETVKDTLELQKDIDSWVEKNKYLPHGSRVDAHIEVLKQNYQELLDIRAEQWELVEKAKADLENFWKTNFPDLREDKWLMWWSE